MAPTTHSPGSSGVNAMRYDPSARSLIATRLLSTWAGVMTTGLTCGPPSWRALPNASAVVSSTLTCGAAGERPGAVRGGAAPLLPAL